MKKILWLDVETTGLDAQKHGLIQLAMLMDIDGKIVDEISLDIQPFAKDMMSIGIDDIANIPTDISWAESQDTYEDCRTPTGITFADIIGFIHPYEAMGKIISFLDKHIAKFEKSDKAYLGGYNIRFDLEFLSSFCKKAKFAYLGSYLNWKCLDPLYKLWQMDYEGEIALENYKLETACNDFNISISAHNAMSDIKATRELWYLVEGM